MLALSEQSESKCARERTCTSTSLRTPAPQAGLSSKFQHPRNFLRCLNIFRGRIRALAHFAHLLPSGAGTRGFAAGALSERQSQPHIKGLQKWPRKARWADKALAGIE